ncbi:MAG: hypothetical protein ABI361_07465 [Nitrososphaera sp.]|jgi:hypothetical protein
MNIDEAEYEVPVVAKTYRSRDSTKRVTYSFRSESHALCMDKKDLIMAQLEACERLLKYASDPLDKAAIEQEIRELRMALDLMT